MNDSIEPEAKLRLIPVTLKAANIFVRDFHRHHNPVIGQKFSIGLSDGSDLRGVIITSRPTARMSDDGFTLEVTRCCTDGVRNGCSMLYRAAWRAAKAMGYLRLITYTLPEEGGASLKGAGFQLIGRRGGGSWNRIKRPRTDNHPITQKLLWELL